MTNNTKLVPFPCRRPLNTLGSRGGIIYCTSIRERGRPPPPCSAELYTRLREIVGDLNFLYVCAKRIVRSGPNA